jgi:hypothetical protein
MDPKKRFVEMHMAHGICEGHMKKEGEQVAGRNAREANRTGG